VKASRFLTHNKKLKDPANALQNLLSRAEHLGPKLGPILFQLSPKWQVNLERLEGLMKIFPRNLRYAFEFRDRTWIKPEIERILERYSAAFCICELAGYQSPLTVTTDFAYVRPHGPSPGKYQNSYDESRLQRWSDQIGNWARKLRAVYIYFDNDEAGFAAQNALTLKRMFFGEDAGGASSSAA